MTIATLLDRMAVFDNELEAGSGEDDETRAITALSLAQDYFETLAASYPRILGTEGAITTTASTERTTYPTGLLRVDDLWMMDVSSTPNRPTYQLDLIDEAGGHIPALAWPLNVTLSPGTGQPRAYWTNDRNIFWRPFPDAVYTLRWYGFQTATDFTVRGDTFAYPDATASGLAAFAVRCLSLGVADDASELSSIAQELFTPLLRQLRRNHRQGPKGRVYSRVHST